MRELLFRRQSGAFQFLVGTTGQYIGMLDMNGKRIFECDIVRYKNRIYEVRYEPCSFVLYSEKAKVFLDVFDAPFIEVIGNVFDNPELLEGVE